VTVTGEIDSLPDRSGNARVVRDLDMDTDTDIHVPKVEDVFYLYGLPSHCNLQIRFVSLEYSGVKDHCMFESSTSVSVEVDIQLMISRVADWGSSFFLCRSILLLQLTGG